MSKKSASTKALKTIRISRSVISGSLERAASNQAGQASGGPPRMAGMTAEALSIASSHPARMPASAPFSSFASAATAGRPP